MSEPIVLIGCGTYDGSTLALTFNPASSSKLSTPAQLTTQFVDTEAHSSSVRTIALSNEVLVSGAGDEYIQVYSLKSCHKVGALDLHSGTINQLTFHVDGQHFVSCSDDASISVWRYCKQENSWESVRRLARHKESITSFALHPTGRLILSVGQDKTMRTWNLLRGRQAYVTRLKDNVNQVLFCPNGERYLHVYDTKIELFDITNPRIEAVLQLRQSINDVAFLDAKHFVVAVGSSIFVYELIKNGVNLLNESTVRSGRSKLLKYIPGLTDVANGILIVVSIASGVSYIDGYNLILPVTKSTNVLEESGRIFAYQQDNIRITCLAACWNVPNVSHVSDAFITLESVASLEANDSNDGDKHESMDDSTDSD